MYDLYLKVYYNLCFDNLVFHLTHWGMRSEAKNKNCCASLWDIMLNNGHLFLTQYQMTFSTPYSSLACCVTLPDQKKERFQEQLPNRSGGSLLFIYAFYLWLWDLYMILRLFNSS